MNIQSFQFLFIEIIFRTRGRIRAYIFYRYQCPFYIAYRWARKQRTAPYYVKAHYVVLHVTWDVKRLELEM